MSTQSTILAPCMAVGPYRANDHIEASVHTLPKPLMREFNHVFRESYLKEMKHTDGQKLELLAIPTNQRAKCDLVAVGDDVEEEKDRLLNVFLEFGAEFCKQVRSKGFWADYIDPCSGLPMLTRDCNKVYSEVDGMECLLNYKAHNAGFCKILTHPKWGSAVYPATMFAHAPREIIVNLLQSFLVPAS